MLKKYPIVQLLIGAVLVFGTVGVKSVFAQDTPENTENPIFDMTDEESYCTSMQALLKSTVKRDPIQAKKLVDICILFSYAQTPRPIRMGYPDPEFLETNDYTKEMILNTLFEQSGKDADGVVAAFEALFHSEAQMAQTEEKHKVFSEFEERWNKLNLNETKQYELEARVMIGNMDMDLLNMEIDPEEGLQDMVPSSVLFDASSIGAIDRSVLMMFYALMQSDSSDDLRKVAKIKEIHIVVTALLFPDRKFKSSFYDVYSDEWQNDSKHKMVKRFLTKANGQTADGLIAEAEKYPVLFGAVFKILNNRAFNDDEGVEYLLISYGFWIKDLVSWRDPSIFFEEKE